MMDLLPSFLSNGLGTGQEDRDRRGEEEEEGELVIGPVQGRIIHSILDCL
jgi:hypothetical protein